MSTLHKLAPLFQLLCILVLGGVLIWRKRTGRWKRPWSFVPAMVLLSLAIVLSSLGTVLSYLGM